MFYFFGKIKEHLLIIFSILAVLSTNALRAQDWFVHSPKVLLQGSDTLFYGIKSKPKLKVLCLKLNTPVVYHNFELDAYHQCNLLKKGKQVKITAWKTKNSKFCIINSPKTLIGLLGPAQKVGGASPNYPSINCTLADGSINLKEMKSLASFIESSPRSPK